MKNVYVLCLLVACSVHAMPNVKNRIKAEDGAVRIPGRINLPLKHRQVALLGETDTRQNESLYKTLKFNGRQVKRLVKPAENEDDREDEKGAVKKNRKKRDIPGLPEGLDLDINFDLDIPPKDLKRADIDFNIKVEVLHPHECTDASLTKPESATESSSSSVKTSAEDTIATEATSSLKTISTAEPTTSVEITIITTATTTVELTTVTATATAAETITATETNISSSMGTSENQSSTLTHTSSPPANATSIVTRLYCAACGISAATVESRIVGGQEAKIGEYPWMVLVFITLKLGGHAICGGSLIKRKWVLSAAHCFHGLNYESVALFLGDHNIATNDEVPTTGFIAHTIRIHPQYDSYSQNNDIALLELSGEATFNERIQPVCLPNAEDVVPGKLAVATGWGYTQYGGSLSDVLREVEVSLISNSQCKKLYSGLATITSNMLCAYSSGKDACQGDSGGPLVTQLEDRRWVLAGIVSFGYRCAYPNTPGVYTHVVNYVPWITEVTTSTDC